MGRPLFQRYASFFRSGGALSAEWGPSALGMHVVPGRGRFADVFSETTKYQQSQDGVPDLEDRGAPVTSTH